MAAKVASHRGGAGVHMLYDVVVLAVEVVLPVDCTTAVVALRCCGGGSVTHLERGAAPWPWGRDGCTILQIKIIL
jgi:hypothetical protein